MPEIKEHSLTTLIRTQAVRPATGLNGWLKDSSRYLGSTALSLSPEPGSTHCSVSLQQKPKLIGSPSVLREATTAPTVKGNKIKLRAKAPLML